MNVQLVGALGAVTTTTTNYSRANKDGMQSSSIVRGVMGCRQGCVKPKWQNKSDRFQ